MVENVARAGIIVGAKQEVAAAIAVGIDGVHKLQTRIDVEVVGISQAGKELAHSVVDLRASNFGDVRFLSPVPERSREDQDRRIVAIQIKPSKVDVVESRRFAD